MKRDLRNKNVGNKKVLLVLVMFLGVSQQFGLPDTSALMAQAASGQLPNKESMMAGLDQYKDQIAEQASAKTGMDKEQIAAGIDQVKSRFMEDGTEIVPDQEAAGEVAESVPTSIDTPSTENIGAPTSPGAFDLKAGLKKALAPVVAANLPKELPTKASTAILEALKEKQSPKAAPSPTEAKAPNHAKKEEPKHEEPASEKAPPVTEGEEKPKEEEVEAQAEDPSKYEQFQTKAGEYKDQAKVYLDKSHQKLKDLHKAAVAKIPKEVMGHEVKPWMKWAVVGSAALCAMVCISYPAVLCYSILQKRKDKYGELE